MKHIHPLNYLRSFAKGENIKQTGLIFTLGTLIFEGTFSALAKGLTEYLTPVALLVISELLTAFFVSISIGLVPIIRTIVRMKPHILLVAIAVGLLNSGLAPFLWFTGLSMTTAVNASLISSIDVIFAVLFGYLFLSERIRGMQIAGAGIVLIGVIMMHVGPRASFHFAVGDIFILFAVITFASGTTLFKKYLTGEHPEVALFIRNLSGIACIVFVCFFARFSIFSNISDAPFSIFLPLIAFAFFSRFLNLSFLYGALDRLPATTVALVLNASPLSGLFFAAVLLGETISSAQAVAALFIIFGLIVEHVSSDMRPKGEDRKVLQYQTQE